MRSKPLALPRNVQPAIDYLKSSLAVGLVYSLPLELYQIAADGASSAHTLDWSGVDAWTASGRTLALQPQEFDMEHTRHTRFFEIVNSRPEARTHVKLHHLDICNDKIQVKRLEIMFVKAPLRQVGLLSPTSIPEDLHLAPLVARMPDTLQALFRWHVQVVGSAQGARRISQDALQGNESLPLSLPTASDVLAQRRALQDLPAVAPAIGTELSTPLDAVGVNIGLSAIQLAAQSAGSNVVRFRDLDGVHLSAIESLERLGVVTTEENDFKELTVSCNHDKIAFLAGQVVSSPVQMFRCGGYKSTCKLGMSMELLRLGWTPKDPLRQAFQESAPKYFQNDWRRPCSYFVCLLEHQQIFDKNVAEIPHVLKEIR